MVGSAATAEAAGVSAEHARVQFASMCCSILKAAYAAVSPPGGDSSHADAACFSVARALIATLDSLTGRSCLGWQACPAASGVPWLAITGRVLLFFAAREQDATSVTCTLQCVPGTNWHGITSQVLGVSSAAVQPLMVVSGRTLQELQCHYPSVTLCMASWYPSRVCVRAYVARAAVQLHLCHTVHGLLVPQPWLSSCR
jgi:hypothetical protein